MNVFFKLFLFLLLKQRILIMCINELFLEIYFKIIDLNYNKNISLKYILRSKSKKEKGIFS